MPFIITKKVKFSYWETNIMPWFLGGRLDLCPDPDLVRKLSRHFVQGAGSFADVHTGAAAASEIPKGSPTGTTPRPEAPTPSNPKAGCCRGSVKNCCFVKPASRLLPM